MGLGLHNQPASNISAGGSTGGVENLPDQPFGGGGASPAGGSGLPSQSGGFLGSGSAEAAPSGNGGVAAGIAGIAGSAAIGGAAKVLKDKKDGNG
jgi:hypothetical protein